MKALVGTSQHGLDERTIREMENRKRLSDHRSRGDMAPLQIYRLICVMLQLESRLALIGPRPVILLNPLTRSG